MNQKPKYLPSFGRLKSRKLRPNAELLLTEVLPKLKITEFPKFDFAVKEIWLEIGFGDGGHLLHQALNNKDVGIIGCEPFVNGTAHLLKGVEENNLENVRIFNWDFREIAEKFPDNSIDRVFILFPDPWPKSKHHKKRIVSQQTFDILNRIMKPGAKLRIGTDHVAYREWIAEQILERKDFIWHAQSRADWETQPADHILTKYQKKALQEGRNSVFFELSKI